MQLQSVLSFFMIEACSETEYRSVPVVMEHILTARKGEKHEKIDRTAKTED